MSNAQLTTATPDAQPPPLAWEFRKMIPTLILSVLMAFAASWWNSQKSQAEFQNRIELLEKRVETNAQNISNNSTSLQQNAIRLAEMGVIQQNTLEQIRDLKTAQNEIRLTLLRK